METSDLYLVGQKSRRPRASNWHLKWGQSCGLSTLPVGSVLKLQIVTVRFELNCRISSWCLENLRTG